MTSTAGALLFDDVVGNVGDSQGFAYVNTLVLSHQADETPQLAVTKASTSNQCKGTEQKSSEKPRSPVMAFVSSNVLGINRTGQPNKKKRDQEAHHLSVTAL